MAIFNRGLPPTSETGVAIMAAAMLVAPFMDMIAKLLTDTMSPGAIAMMRLAVQSVILLPFVVAAGQWGRPTWRHVAAGALLATALVSINWALKYMPIANALAIFFVEPLILTLLSALILGEGLGWRRLTAVSAGLVGAMIVIRPNWQAFGVAAVYPLITAFSFAGYLLMTRMMTRDGDHLAMQFWFGLMAAVILFAANSAGGWAGTEALALTWPGGAEMKLILALGVLAALAHWMMVQAMARAEAGTLAPLQYLEIFSGTLIGWFVFQDFPDALTWLGAAIIVGSGIYVFRRERQLSRAPR